MKYLAYILIITSLLVSIPVNAKHVHSEEYYQKIDCAKKNGTIEYRIKNVRVDCINKEYAIEYDFTNKFYEGISQALYYSQLTGYKPGLVLIKTGENDEVFIKRAKEIIEHWKLPIKLEVLEK